MQEIRLTSNKCINLEAARELGAEDIVERVLQLTQLLTRLRLDAVEYACLKVIVLMQPGECVAVMLLGDGGIQRSVVRSH